LRKNGVKVISATEAISEGAEGILLESLLEGMAEYYSIELGVKVSRGQTENALKAHHNGGTVPYGLTVDEERHYQPDPLTAPVVHEIFQRYADGDSVAEIIRSLSAQGIQTKTGGNQLNYNSVNFVIDDTIMKASPQQRLRGINPYRRGLFLTSSSTTLPCRPVC
jgi:DNA invertase Pin-like site-specific DNA recombinase